MATFRFIQQVLTEAKLVHISPPKGASVQQQFKYSAQLLHHFAWNALITKV